MAPVPPPPPTRPGWLWRYASHQRSWDRAPLQSKFTTGRGGASPLTVAIKAAPTRAILWSGTRGGGGGRLPTVLMRHPPQLSVKLGGGWGAGGSCVGGGVGNPLPVAWPQLKGPRNKAWIVSP